MIKQFFLFALLGVLLSACIRPKKYQQTEYLLDECMKRERQLQAQLDFARAQIDEMQGRNEELSNMIGVLKDDKASLEDDTSRLENRIRNMERRSRSTQAGLAAELESKSQQLAEKEERLQEIREALDRRDQRLEAAHKALADTLRLISADDASLAMREGRLYITFSDDLLFGGRSTFVSKDGEKALAIAATVLNRYPDLEVVVMGHTSTDRPGRGYANNWDLSVRRAASVVQILTEELNVSSNQVTAAGKGEFKPLAPNDNNANKLRNKRLELILTPRLETIYSIMRED